MGSARFGGPPMDSPTSGSQAGVTSPVAGFWPSPHLNLGECCRKLDQMDQAREHLKLGLVAVEFLADDGYGATIK